MTWKAQKVKFLQHTNMLQSTCLHVYGLIPLTHPCFTVKAMRVHLGLSEGTEEMTTGLGPSGSMVPLGVLQMVPCSLSSACLPSLSPSHLFSFVLNLPFPLALLDLFLFFVTLSLSLILCHYTLLCFCLCYNRYSVSVTLPVSTSISISASFFL